MTMKRNRVVLESRNRWWRIRVGLYHRKINRRKYYGVQSIITQYRQIILDVFKPLFNDLNNFFKAYRKESIGITYEMGVSDMLNMFLGEVKISTDALERINKLLIKSFKRGGKRVMNRQGNKIEVKYVDEKAISALLQKQPDYLKKWDKEIRLKVRDSVIDGLKQGKTFRDMQRDIMKQAQDITENRAMTIARTEVVKASAEGVEQGLLEAGVEWMIWMTARDNRVCPVCKELDGKRYRVKDTGKPRPAESTHPNCRCVVVADL